MLMTVFFFLNYKKNCVQQYLFFDTWNNEMNHIMKHSPEQAQSLDLLVPAKPISTKLSSFASHLFFRIISHTIFNKIHPGGLLNCLILKVRTKHQVFVIGICRDLNCNNVYINETWNFINNFLILDEPEVNARLKDKLCYVYAKLGVPLNNRKKQQKSEGSCTFLRYLDISSILCFW